MQPDFRIWHWLRPVVGSGAPRRWILLDALSRPYQSDTSDRETIEGLRAVGCLVLNYEHGYWHSWSTMVLRDCTAARDWLHGACLSGTCTWWMGWRISRALEMIDWWREIERGSFAARVSDDSEPNPDLSLPLSAAAIARCLVTADPPTIVSGWWRNRSICIVDSRNYWDCDIESLAAEQRVQLHALPATGLVDAAVEAYLHGRLDVLRLHLQRSIDSWLALTDSRWCYTAAGCAWHAFRGSALPRETVLIHGDSDAIALERGGYYGGETRCEYVGRVSTAERLPACPDLGGQLTTLVRGQGVDHYDVSSQYPSLLRDHAVPVQLLGVRRGDRRLAGCLIDPGRWAVAYCRVRSGRSQYPCRVHAGTTRPLLGPGWLLDRMTLLQPHRTIYPVGEWDTVLCGPELEQAHLLGDLVRVYCWAEYRTALIGGEWIRRLQSSRREYQRDGLTVQAGWIKRCLNALIGRFGQARKEWVPEPREEWHPQYGTWVSVDADTGEIEHWRSIAGRTQSQRPAGEGENSCPAIAAAITCLGRWQMRQIRAVLPASAVYYQDTDSVWVDALLSRGCTLPEPGADVEPGGLRHVGHSDSLVLLGARTYWTDQGWVVSGIHQPDQLARGEQWSWERRDTADSILRRGPGQGYRVSRGTRSWRITDPGGVIGADGWVSPYEVRPAPR